METVLSCPSCGSAHIKLNGPTHYGKQNHRCKDCGRQFVEGGGDWFVSEQDRSIVNALLLERISLSGICRAVKVSQSWLLNHIKELYTSLPDSLGAEETLPGLEIYLADRMDEEIGRLEAIKKIRSHWNSTPKLATGKTRRGRRKRNVL